MNVLLENVNYLGVLVCSLLYFAIRAVWFEPKTFYPVWMRALGRNPVAPSVRISTASTILMFGATRIGALFGFLFPKGLGAFASLSHRCNPCRLDLEARGSGGSYLG